MTKEKIAAVGDHSCICLFRAAGIKTVSVKSAKGAENAIIAFIKQGVEIIFLSEKYAAELQELMDCYRSGVYPIILTVPERSGSTGYATDKLRINMEKAVGRNIFDES